MNFFFCCNKRDDKSSKSTNKPSKESLYNFVINEHLQKRKIVEEDYESKTATNNEVASSISAGDLIEKDLLSKPPLQLPENNLFKKEDKFMLSINLEPEEEKHYEYLLLERDRKEEWELEKDNEDLKIWVKMGSIYHEKCPFVKACFRIHLLNNENLRCEDILEALYIPEKRMSWDTSILKFEKNYLDESKTRSIAYSVTKVPIFANRDFVEKRLIFKDLKTHEDVSINWSVEDEKYPKNSDPKRTFTKIGGTFLQRKENCIEVWTLSQVDAELKAYLPASKKLLTMNMEKWLTSLRNYLKNIKN